MSPIVDGRRFSGLQCVYREMLEARVVAMSLGAAATVAVVAAVLGPVGIEAQFEFLDRVAIVGACCAICWPICHALSAAILFVMRSRPPLHVFLGWALGALFLSVPCSTVAYAVYTLFASRDLGPDLLPAMFLNVAVLVLPISFLVHYVAYLRVKLRLAGQRGRTSICKPSSQEDLGGEQAQTPAPLRNRNELLERFFDRIPDTLGTDLVYLTVSGHYIDVVTTAGSCLVLMRFADAVAALGDLGIRVHRSHWVANRHIIASIRRDGRMFIRVTGPHEIPVSRSYVDKVRTAISSLRGGDHAS